MSNSNFTCYNEEKRLILSKMTRGARKHLSFTNLVPQDLPPCMFFREYAGRGFSHGSARFFGIPLCFAGFPEDDVPERSKL